ncbi:MAG: hypothetical protein WAM60_21445, partial [Candidatus Promineifilaceae bacterium]
MIIRNRSKLFWAAVLLLAGAAAWPLLSRVGLLNTRGGGDSPFLLQRLYELTTALRDGHFPVRWMPDANYGYGYPFYNFYAPLSIYITAVFRFLGFSYVGAIKTAQLAGFLVAGGGMFYLGRRWFGSSWAGLLAAAAYTFAPFHMVNVYVRGDSLAEFWAMAFYPLLFIAADHLVHQPKRPTTIAFFSLSYAALIVSHNISALIFTPFLLLYLALALLRKFRQKPTSQSTSLPRSGHQPITDGQSQTKKWLAVTIVLSLLLALALSAWFWLPAISEQGLAQLGPVTAGYFHFSNHFRGLDLVQNSVLFDYNVAGGRAFRMGLVQLIVIAAGVCVLLAYGVRKKGLDLWPSLLLLFSLLVATFMMTPLSRPFWDHLPLLPFTQFPWRFLSVQAFFGALAVGALALLPGRKMIVPVVVLLIAASGLGDLHTDHLYLTDADVTAERLAEYEWFTGNIGTTVSAEYLPPFVQPRPFTSPWLTTGSRNDVSAPVGGVEAEPISQEANRQSWLISTTVPTTTVSLPLLDWPGWEAAIDGSPVDSHPADGSGLLTLVVPEGEHTVELRLTQTPVRAAGDIVSLAAVLIVGILIWPSVRRNVNGRQLKWAAVGMVGLLLFGIGLRFWPVPTRSPDTLSWDFEQLGYLHHSPDGIPFEDGSLLKAYHYSEEAIKPGEELTITLDWENGDGETAEIALMTPAVQRIEDAPILVQQEQTVESGEVVYRLTVPQNAPAGLFVPRLMVAGVRSLTDSGQVRGDLFLRPIRVLDGFYLADRHSPLMGVRAVDVGYQSPEVLLVQLQWLTLKALTENYNVSLRLVDANGVVLAQRDAQPGFGYLPSSGWRAGRWENDWLTLRLPEDLSAETGSGSYGLVVRLYDLETDAVILTRHLGEMVWEGEGLVFQESTPVLELQDGITPAVATFEERIRLEGFTLEQSAESLDLMLFWRSLVNGQEDY